MMADSCCLVAPELPSSYQATSLGELVTGNPGNPPVGGDLVITRYATLYSNGGV
jgi:hypothetical protein